MTAPAPGPRLTALADFLAADEHKDLVRAQLDLARVLDAARGAK